LAGVPSVMRGMLEDIGHRLEGGAVVTAQTLRVDGFAEGVLAEPLGALAKANPDLSLGSYPFFGPDGYGANLVVRGRDPVRVDQVLGELEVSLRAAGATQLARV
jgi:molybdopterin-biosynthesis enzyme MoeA-like protein